MAERPDRDEAAEPDRPEGASETPSADAWSDAVDHPHDGLQDSPTGPADLFDGPADRPRMGFSGGAPAVRASRPRVTPGMTTTTISASWGRCSSSCSAGGGQGMPRSRRAGPPARRSGGQGGQLPDIEALMRQLGGDRGLAGAGDAIQQMWKQMGIDPTDSGVMAMLQNQMKQMFGAQTPEARMEMSTDVARKTVASETDPTVTAAQQREVDDAVHVANLWVDPVTTLPAPNGKGLAWSRAEWVEATMPTWHRLVEPVSEGVTAAMTKAMDEQFERLKAEGLSGLTEGIEGLPEGFPNLSGLDLGNLIGQLQPAAADGREHVLGPAGARRRRPRRRRPAQRDRGGPAPARHRGRGTAAANVAAFTEGLGVDVGEVRLYLAVREAARARLFAQVRGSGRSSRRRSGTTRGTSPSTPTPSRSRSGRWTCRTPPGSRRRLRDKLFSPTPTAEQRAALDRLETSLALVEGWVDLVTEQATRRISCTPTRSARRCGAAG